MKTNLLASISQLSNSDLLSRVKSLVSRERMSTAWLVGVARHKLVDHWRRLEREQRSLAAAEASSTDIDDPWDEWLDAEAAYAALAHLPGPQRAALTLRYLDGLPVGDVAEHLGRTLHGTETLLARSRAALRRHYREGHHHAR